MQLWFGVDFRPGIDVAILASMPVVVRPVTVDDAWGLAAVHVASWQWAYAGLLPAGQLAALSVEDRAARWASGPG